MSGEDDKAQVESPEAQVKHEGSKSESKADGYQDSTANGDKDTEEKEIKKATKRKATAAKKVNDDSGDDAEVDSEGSEVEDSSPKKKKVPLVKKSPVKKPKKRDSSDDEQEVEAKVSELKKSSKKQATPKKTKKEAVKVEEDEEDEEEDVEPKKKGIPLLDQPLQVDGSRERKKVARLEYNTPAEEKKAFAVPEGKGTKLRDIPRIDLFIGKTKVDDIKPVAKALFGARGPPKAVLRKMIREFNGYDFNKTSDQWEKRVALLSKSGTKQLKVICGVLDLERSGTLVALVERIMEFCLEPKDSGKKLPVSKSKRKSKSGSSKKSVADSEESDAKSSRSKNKRGKNKRVSLKDVSNSESEEEQPKRSRNARSKKTANYKDESSDDEVKRKDDDEKDDEKDNEETNSKNKSDDDANNKSDVDDDDENNKSEGDDEDNDESEEKAKSKKIQKPASKRSPKKTSKKAPVRKAVVKKKISESEEEEKRASSSEDDEPLVKKVKAPTLPSDEEIKSYVKKILEGANLEEITMKTVCKQVYEHYPDHDLAHKKDLIKDTVKSLISP